MSERIPALKARDIMKVLKKLEFVERDERDRIFVLNTQTVDLLLFHVIAERISDGDFFDKFYVRSKFLPKIF